MTSSLTASPVLPSVLDGGFVKTTVTCASCEAKMYVHSSRQHDGGLSPEPWKLASEGTGYRIEPRTGSIVCGPTCYNRLHRHAEESKFAVDASRNPLDPRIRGNGGAAPNGPVAGQVERREVRFTCACLEGRTTVHQSRQATTAGTWSEWLPVAAKVAASLGWVEYPAGSNTLFCSKFCVHRAGHDPRLLKPTAVLQVPDVAYQRDRARIVATADAQASAQPARVPAGYVKNPLAADPEPAKAAASKGARR